ncbi:MAG: radical SAM protein [Parcubacteria group bacterium]|nr:radical SAM protein [Parcubacteria group bacterium]
MYPDKFPVDLINDVNGWAFSAQVMEENKGKLLTLDIDFGNFCMLNCPHCFRRDNGADLGSKQMDFDDVLRVVQEGKKLGLRSVKFLGAGEPFENPRFLEFLQELKKLDIIPVIFTKGHIIGDDNLAAHYNRHHGIKNSEELIEKLDEVGASILLGFNSFDPDVQDKMVGDIKGYTAKRNRALELLAKAGFNQHNPTRLCLAANPITHSNYDELLAIYKWGRWWSMYVVICPTMVSGRCAKETDWSTITPSPTKLIDLYTEIYRFNLERGIQTKEQIIQEGIASYAGGHPCNQVACGMYVTLTGKVLRCPGDDVTFFGSIWEESLADIWHKSENYQRAGCFNCGCPPKHGKSIPGNLFTKVMENMREM